MDLLEREPRGRLLDCGCGDGWLSKGAKDMGFSVEACDLDSRRFKFHMEIPFIQADLNQPLPFEDNSFNYIVSAEVIEHLEAPQFTLREFHRILQDKNTLIITTPNILNLKSRMRFLFEGAFDYFREPPLEQVKNPRSGDLDIHANLFRLQEMEFILVKNGFKIELITTSFLEPQAKTFSFLLPIISFQMYLKRSRARKKGNIDYNRIHTLLSSKELLFGRHLIIKAKKNGIQG